MADLPETFNSTVFRSVCFSFSVLLVSVLAACAPPETPDPTVSLEPVPLSDLPGYGADDLAGVVGALTRSCDRLAVRAPPRPPEWPADAPGIDEAAWRSACVGLAAVPDGDAGAVRRYLATHFSAYAVHSDSDGLFTGYYEAELNGARTRTERYRWPILALPTDHVQVRGQNFDRDDVPPIVGRVENGRLVPYDTRAEIEAAISDTARFPRVVYVDDPVDAFFLHIQGSGRVKLAEGGEMRIGFAGHNGHGFVGIGGLMLERGLIDRNRSTMPEIRDWLRAHPVQARALMHENPRYIFFREIEGAGPIGALGAPLTPWRSLAVDPAYMPLGLPVWLDSRDPFGAPLQRLMVAQDTGAAIKGPVRGDFYFGSGAPALRYAGRMKSPGRYFVLLPKLPAAGAAQS